MEEKKAIHVAEDSGNSLTNCSPSFVFDLVFNPLISHLLDGCTRTSPTYLNISVPKSPKRIKNIFLPSITERVARSCRTICHVNEDKLSYVLVWVRWNILI